MMVENSTDNYDNGSASINNITRNAQQSAGRGKVWIYVAAVVVVIVVVAVAYLALSKSGRPYTTNAVPQVTLAGTPSAPTGIDSGGTIAFKALVSGGSGNYTYTFYIYNSITGAVVSSATTPKGSYTFATNTNLIGDTLNANAVVTGSNGNPVSSTPVGPYTINNIPIITLIGAPFAPAGIEAGNAITLNAFVSGGTGGYTYTFYIYNSATKAAVSSTTTSANSFVFITKANLIGSTLLANVSVTDGTRVTANSVMVGPYTINAT